MVQFCSAPLVHFHSALDSPMDEEDTAMSNETIEDVSESRADWYVDGLTVHTDTEEAAA